MLFIPFPSAEAPTTVLVVASAEEEDGNADQQEELPPVRDQRVDRLQRKRKQPVTPARSPNGSPCAVPCR